MRARIVAFCVMAAAMLGCAIVNASSPATQPAAAAKSQSAATRPTALKLPSASDLIAKIKNAGEDATAPAGPHVAYFNLDRPISEKPSDFSFFETEQSMTLRALLDRLDRARQDKDIQAVLVTVGTDGPSLAQALELRDALVAVKKSGKRTFVYADSYDAPSYVMASGATDVCMLGGGDVEMPGVGLEVMFAKGLLDKIGVEADYEQIGEFKGADEEYIHTAPSPEMSGELNRLVDGLYAQLVTNISKSRHIPESNVRQIVDQALIPAEDAKKLGLVDHLVDIDGLRDLLGDELGGKIDLQHDYGQSPRQSVDLSNPLALFSLLSKRPAESDRQAVALIYAQGVIVDGQTQDSLFSNSDQIGSDDMRQALRLAERDDQIGAVVIRIDSPGGSALASEAMWQAVRRVAKVKPVVISVGDMAASGGYYLATSGGTIFADPTSIVGSIGVVGGKFVYSGLYAKLGLSTATFERGANAGLFGSDAPWTPGQRKLVHAWMQQTYDQFTRRVMTTRKGKIKEIDKVARGRIFLAPQAKELGLIDEIGGVTEAIACAAKQADMAPGSYDVRVVPGPKTLADFFSGGPDAKIDFKPSTIAATPPGDALLSLLPPQEQALVRRQITTLRLFEARPVALVCPYVIQNR